MKGKSGHFSRIEQNSFMISYCSDFQQARGSSTCFSLYNSQKQRPHSIHCIQEGCSHSFLWSRSNIQIFERECLTCCPPKACQHTITENILKPLLNVFLRLYLQRSNWDSLLQVLNVHTCFKDGSFDFKMWKLSLIRSKCLALNYTVGLFHSEIQTVSSTSPLSTFCIQL